MRNGQAGMPVLRLLAKNLVAFRYIEVAQPIHVLRDAAIYRIGNMLAMIGMPQQVLLLRIAEETDLNQNRRHAAANQHHERRLFDSTILFFGVIEKQGSRKRRLHAGGELPRLAHFFVQCDPLHQVLQIMNGFPGAGIFA